jgi:hypothetical protein
MLYYFHNNIWLLHPLNQNTPPKVNLNPLASKGGAFVSKLGSVPIVKPAQYMQSVRVLCCLVPTIVPVLVLVHAQLFVEQVGGALHLLLI